MRVRKLYRCQFCGGQSKPGAKSKGKPVCEHHARGLRGERMRAERSAQDATEIEALAAAYRARQAAR